ncbi:MAG TPA: imelysin family protein [Steroidobacteraceae bacterium]|nr:imelysin family protein [Steroidobacteraceae bacterium]
MLRKFRGALFAFSLFAASGDAQSAVDAQVVRPQLETYAQIAYRAYAGAYEYARVLQRAVDQFVAEPGDDANEQLEILRQAWLDAHASYGLTEVFRFYEGPIDFGKRPDGSQGPELLLNAWPLNEAYIEDVIANDVPITRELLIDRNARDDEADVTTGYHAIEYLLWGPDRNAHGPGQRSPRDFLGDGAASRRRQYLKVATDLLVEHLAAVVAAWSPGAPNYRESFLRLHPSDSLAKVLTGLATLSGFELGFERLATALDSGSQEDEQSCFSDSTIADVVANVTGVADVYFGRFGDFQGAGLDSLLATEHPAINELLRRQIAQSQALAQALDRPCDRTLSTPPGSSERAKVEALITSLQTQTRLFKQAGAALGVSIVVDTEYE